MCAESLAIGVREVMNNHKYKFNGELRVKENEGSMGDELTGVLAEIKMLKWNIKFSSKLKSLHIENDINCRFIDDISVLPTVTKPGIVFRNNVLDMMKIKWMLIEMCIVMKEL